MNKSIAKAYDCVAFIDLFEELGVVLPKSHHRLADDSKLTLASGSKEKIPFVIVDSPAVTKTLNRCCSAGDVIKQFRGATRHKLASV